MNMDKTIEYCCENNVAASIYYDAENIETHLTGYIDSFDESALVVRHISFDGNYDGYVVKRYSDIWRIHYDGEYEKKVTSLYELKRMKHERIPQKYESVVLSALDFAWENKLLVTLDMIQIEVTGFVVSFDDNWICMDTVNSYAEKDGVTVVAYDEVDTILIDTEEEQAIQLLYHYNIQKG